MRKIAAIVGIGIMSISIASAQQDTTLNRTVIVENEYNPTVMDASKINVMPKMNEPKATKKNINYATSLREVSVWDYQTMSPVVREWESDAAYRGYLRAGYGNNGNVDLRAGYLWDISQRDRLNVSASLNGWNADLTEEDLPSRFYHTKAGLDYKHSFNKLDFTLGGLFQSQVFNYIANPHYPLEDKGARNQHRTLGNAYLGFAATDEDMPIQFAAELGFNYLNLKYPVATFEKGNETDFYVLGDVWKCLNDAHRLGLGVRFDHYSYSWRAAENSHALDLNPYYAIRNGNWNVRIGAHVDWWGGSDDKVYIAPDIDVEHHFSESYVLYAKAGGGREVSSLYELTEITPFWNNEYQPSTYMNLDAALGLKGSPVDGLWFHVGGGYQIRENDICLSPGTGGSPVFFACNYGGDTKVFYGTVGLRYDYKDLFDVSLGGTYYNWKWEDSLGWVGGPEPEEEALSLKPELEITAEVGMKVIDNLRAKAGYEYVGRCGDLYDPVSNLYIGADYALLKNVGVFAKINNLLNKEYVRADAYPAQGFNFLAGLSVQF